MLTAKLTEKKGGLAGALIVGEHQELLFISQNGMVQRTGVRGISKQGRPAQGVRVMNLRDDDQVSAVALVMESADTAAHVEAELDEPADEFGLLVAGWAEVSGVAALLLLLQPTVISPNASRTSKLCFISTLLWQYLSN